MPSIGHLAVGLAAGRVAEGRLTPRRWVTTALLVAVSAAPDLDVGGLLLRAPNGSPWGHRGASHSLVSVLLLTGLAFVGARHWRLPVLRVATVAALTALSHLVLDSMNVGSLGVPWLWPVSSAMTGFPWQPIPAVVEVKDFLTSAGVRVILAELVLFSPAMVYALWPRRSDVAVEPWDQPVEET